MISDDGCQKLNKVLESNYERHDLRTDDEIQPRVIRLKKKGTI